jgi:adenylosuccinate synthase
MLNERVFLDYFVDMTTTVVLGAQWGDEGKGKLVDVLSSNAEWVARFQGGNNAGHTVVIGDRIIKLHLLPSGIIRTSCQLILGDGMVIDPWVLNQELEKWKEETGDEPDKDRLFISDRAHIILKFHRLLDGLDKKIGTTGRGIGPTYSDKINRVGIRFADLKHIVNNTKWISEMCTLYNNVLVSMGVEEKITKKDLKNDLEWIHNRFGHAITNTGLMLDNALKLNQNVLLEGAQGCLLDIDQGTYPYVTSSITSRGNATHGVGIHPGHVDEVIGIVKAYTTRVGHGPFPCELKDEIGDYLTEKGHEFGTTTGRRRRCGWLDLVVLKHSHRVNGFTSLAITKLDVLGGIDNLKICVGYKANNLEYHNLPASVSELENAVPIYIEMPGFPALSDQEWLELARTANKNKLGLEGLPINAQKYISQIETLLKIPIHSIGVGPDRDATIHLL